MYVAAPTYIPLHHVLHNSHEPMYRGSSNFHRNAADQDAWTERLGSSCDAGALSIQSSRVAV